jgi:antitoxin (DNA-binding transcriptional repressor) of toxin-antitoxin stability system
MTARIGTRELRADLAALVRRAAGGEQIVVTVGGTSTALLGPIGGQTDGMSSDALVAGGLLVPPRRFDPYRPVPPVAIWSGVRLDRALRELRG